MPEKHGSNDCGTDCQAAYVRLRLLDVGAIASRSRTTAAVFVDPPPSDGRPEVGYAGLFDRFEKTVRGVREPGRPLVERLVVYRK